MSIEIGKSYKYGIKEIKTIDVVFNTDFNNVLLTNELCGGDPVYGQVKYLYDENWNIICKEYDILFSKNNYIGITLKGGMGNIMFQIAILYSLSKKYNLIPIIEHIDSTCYIHTNKEYEFTKIFKRNINNIQYNQHYYEKDGEFSTYINIIAKQGKNILLDGYFQNEKYFKEYKNDLIYLFNIKYTGNKYNGEKKCFIHIRRGDYININLHNVNLIEYYKKSIEYIKNIHNDCIFYIFSDDINWCKNNDLFNSINCYFIDDLNDVETMGLMILCEYGGICANSTFSWWGVYLNENENKKMIFPKIWFNCNWNIDIYPENSVVI